MHDMHHGLLLGYHGCDEAVAEKLLSGQNFSASENDYDWLGHGIYFWERDPKRGLEFATELANHPTRGANITKPAVVGAVVAPGRCLDRTTRSGVGMVKSAYNALEILIKQENNPDAALPKNSPDLLRRNLDCAVINTLHDIRKDRKLQAFDTVRGVFEEGEEAYPESGFKELTHVQIAVRSKACILGVFRVPDSALK
jgi:hypothetical protein